MHIFELFEMQRALVGLIGILTASSIFIFILMNNLKIMMKITQIIGIAFILGWQKIIHLKLRI